jgi:hypothetical protein
MKRSLLALILLFFTFTAFPQQFSQYNTGTLYDSFENPSQASFTPDTSRRIAFNFFVPNFNTNFYITGNSQIPLKSRAFNGNYENTNLQIGENRINYINTTTNAYLFMLKVFTSLNGNAEIGVSAQTRVEGRGMFTDETIALFDGAGPFSKDSYSNIFNNNATVQSYHQISFSYREKINKSFAFGLKLSALLGIQYQKLNIDQSEIYFDRPNKQAYLSMAGQYRISYTSGIFNQRDIQPSFKNPGISISLGTSFHTRDNFIIQANVKDLGFIHWGNQSNVYDFDGLDVIKMLSTGRREANIFGAAYRIIHTNGTTQGFISPTNAKAELSAHKSFWIDDNKQFKYAPTVVLSKEVFYDGVTAALVNPVQYKNLVLTATASYNNYKILDAGLQLMVKSPNMEFYIGSDRLIQSASLVSAIGNNEAQINKNASYTGADIFLGFSFKFGDVIEHPLNANYIPLSDEKGFISRLYNSIFKRKENKN